MTADEMDALLAQAPTSQAVKKPVAASTPSGPFAPGGELSKENAFGLGMRDTPPQEALKNAGVMLLTGGLSGLGEAAAMKMAPAAVERTLPGLLARATGAAAGGALGSGIAGQSPGLGALYGAGGSLMSSALNRSEAATQKTHEGGAQTLGRVMKFVNDFGERIGLKNLVSKPEEIGEVFAAKKPVGINQPVAPGSPFERYADEIYDPFLKNDVGSKWPQQGMPIPALDKFAETYGPENLAASAETKYAAQQDAMKNAQAALAKAQAMPAQTAAQFQAQQQAIQQAQGQIQQAAQPPMYDVADAIDTAAQLRHKGWSPKTLDKKPGLDASLARTEGHNLVEALGQNMDQLDPSGELSQAFYNHRANMNKINAITKFIDKAYDLGGEDVRLGHFQRAALENMDDYRMLNQALGADAKPLMKILTRGVEGRPTYFDTVMPPSINAATGTHSIFPHLIAHMRGLIPRILRPGVDPGSVEQLLQTGIPAAILQQQTQE